MPTPRLEKHKDQFYRCDTTFVCWEACPFPPRIRRWSDQTRWFNYNHCKILLTCSNETGTDEVAALMLEPCTEKKMFQRNSCVEIAFLHLYVLIQHLHTNIFSH